MKREILICLATLCGSAGVLGHGGESHAITATASQPTAGSAVVQHAPDAVTLARELSLETNTAARLSALVGDYKTRLAGLLDHYSSTADENSRARLVWIMQQAALHHRRQLHALLTPVQLQAFFNYADTQLTLATHTTTHNHTIGD